MKKKLLFAIFEAIGGRFKPDDAKRVVHRVGRSSGRKDKWVSRQVRGRSDIKGQLDHVDSKKTQKLRDAEDIQGDISASESSGLSQDEKLEMMNEISQNITKLGGKKEFKKLNKAQQKAFKAGDN